MLNSSLFRTGAVIFASISGLTLMALTSHAQPPLLQSPAPVIYLADNLDEPDRLGWCIDTVGRGFAETLHAHSCKPAGRGQDTQFSYDTKTRQVRSVPYKGKCMTLSDPENKAVPFGLLDCVDAKKSQQFVYDAGTQELRIAGEQSKCVVVAPTAKSAGPFVSRQLSYADCGTIDRKFKQWVIKN